MENEKWLIDVREKLVELLERAFEHFIDDPYCIPDEKEFADHLIANGVTILDCKRDCANCWKTKMVTPMWISVKDRLPEQASRCLVARWDYVTSTPFLDILWFEKGVWWNRLHGGNYAVTHWMPLPEPPDCGAKMDGGE